MIDAKFIKDEDDFIRKVSISGHAGFDEYGFDVVCASVSALIIATINSLEEYVGLETGADVKDGYTTFEVRPETEVQRIQADALTKGLYLAMEGMSEEYEDFIQIDISEERK